MLSKMVHQDSELIPPNILRLVHGDIFDALASVTANGDSSFIVNDSQWFNIIPNKRGVIEPKPRVMNSADFPHSWHLEAGLLEIKNKKSKAKEWMVFLKSK
jgi:hypothetical protein